MEKRYYDAGSLERTLGALEHRFGLASADFMALHEADDSRVASIPRFIRHTWASFYVDCQRMHARDDDDDEDDFGAQVGREVELV